MPTRIAALFCLLSLLPLAGWSDSWEDEKQVWEQMSNSKTYKDPGYAAKLSLNFWPVDNGHFYVGDVGKGIWFSVGETAALVAAAMPVLTAQARVRQDKSPTWTTSMVVSAALGGLSYIGLKVWSGYDAADGARRFNAAHAHARTQGFEWGLTPGGLWLARRW